MLLTNSSIYIDNKNPHKQNNKKVRTKESTTNLQLLKRKLLPLVI